jgi:hypothetical protein
LSKNKLTRPIESQTLWKEKPTRGKRDEIRNYELKIKNPESMKAKHRRTILGHCHPII